MNSLIKSEADIEKIKKGGSILYEVLKELKKAIKPGVEGKKLDELAYKIITQNKAKPSFKNYQGYQYSICLSLNEEIVHGLPDRIVLKEGDVVSIDAGVYYQGFHTDAAITLGVGKISSQAQKLIDITKKSLMAGVKAAKEGNFIADISGAIEKVIRKGGFWPVIGYTGHGIGHFLHEPPAIPNVIEYLPKSGKIKKGLKLKEGMVLAIEPMATTKEGEGIVLSDGWTIVNENGGLSAHFETTVVVRKNGGQIIVPLDF